MDQIGEDRDSWDRQRGESSRAYENFCAYRDLGSIRSLAKVARSRRLAVATLGEQSKRHGWVARAEAYDLHLEGLQRSANEARHTAQIEEHRSRALTTAIEVMPAKCMLLERLQRRIELLAAEEITPQMIPQMLRAVVAVTEASLAAEAQALAVDELLELLARDGRSK